MKTPCVDCGHDHKVYMVADPIWAEARGPDDGYLCVSCLGSRLGRDLWPRDFTDVPCNAWLKAVAA